MARAVSTGGAIRPYTNYSKVVIVQCGVAGWFIMAEYVAPQPNYDVAAAGFNARTIAAEQTDFGAFSEVDYRFGGGQANFREVDSDGQIAPSAFSGGAKLSNKQARHADESSIRIEDFGDILIEASKMAFMWLSKKTERVFLKCREFELRSVGYRFNTVCPSVAEEDEAEVINKVTVAAEIYPDAVNLSPAARCYEFISGFQQSFVGTIIKLGQILSFKADNTNKKVSMVLGNDKKTTVNFDESSDSIKIEKDGQVIEMTPTTLAFTHKGQYIKLTDAGLEITAKAIRIDSQEQTTVSSSGPVTLVGTVINMN
jgi:hypothetical protein